MPNHAEPLGPPPPVAANVNQRWYTTCVHHVKDQHAGSHCALHGQQYLFGQTPCAKCKAFSRRKP